LIGSEINDEHMMNCDMYPREDQIDFPLSSLGDSEQLFLNLSGKEIKEEELSEDLATTNDSELKKRKEPTSKLAAYLGYSDEDE
ncbi:hypothetical protein PMAYCL1PPCAC_13947, partial [Pristionchus mayeri]